MRTFHCRCGNTAFFENSQCLACGCELGWCPACLGLRSILPSEGGAYRCAEVSCGASLVKCRNYEQEHVCNRCVSAEDHPTGTLCDYCRFNHTIPDLSAPGAREKWLRLEVAKRRLLYSLDLLGLPYGNENDGVEPPLSFDFKEDVVEHRWWVMGTEERVYTGHANGKITINLREADPVEREKARTAFDEAHRTVIGHFRHEIGHYYWEMLVKGRREEACKAVFGDHENPGYGESLERYYEAGPPLGWRASYISAYATMHPWEDFAETFATYLDMVSVLDTASNMGIGDPLDPRTAEFREMVARYANLGVVLNEMNRAMGLMDLVPEVFLPGIVAKCEFIHRLVRDGRRSPKPSNFA